jgi:hypothetical protein
VASRSGIAHLKLQEDLSDSDDSSGYRTGHCEFIADMIRKANDNAEKVSKGTGCPQRREL